MVFQPGDDAKEALAAIRVFANDGKSSVGRVQNEGGQDGHGLAGLDSDHRGWHDVTRLVKVQVQSVKQRQRSRSYRQKHKNTQFLILNNIDWVPHDTNSLLFVYPDSWFGVQEGDTFQLQQGVVDRVGEEVPHPLGHHHRDHHR